MHGTSSAAGAAQATALPRKYVVSYAAMTVPLAVAGLPIAIFVAPLYTDHVGLSLTTVGILLMLPRLVELLIDPLIGRLSDLTRSRFGRRKPWIMVGIPVMMLGTYGVFMPERDAHWGELLGWLCLFYLGWSLITVPYAAWGAELSEDYDERSRIATARETWSVLGLLAAVIVPVLVQAPDQGGSLAERETAEIASGVAAQGWLTIAALPVLGYILLRFVPLGNVPTSTSRPTVSRRVLLDNRPFVLLIAVTIISAFASGVNQTSVVHYYRYVAQLPESADFMILIFFVAAIVGAPVWGWLAKHHEKHHVLASALTVNALCQFVMLWMQPGDVIAFSLLQAGSGFAYTGPLILGASMAADVIDLDWLRCGVQRAGFVIAVMTVVQKACEAIGVGASLPMLEWMGFAVSNGYSAQAQWALIVINVILPAALLALATIPAMAFPLTRRRQRALERALHKYRSSSATPPPIELDKSITST